MTASAPGPGAPDDGKRRVEDHHDPRREQDYNDNGKKKAGMRMFHVLLLDEGTYESCRNGFVRMRDKNAILIISWKKLHL